MSWNTFLPPKPLLSKQGLVINKDSFVNVCLSSPILVLILQCMYADAFFDVGNCYRCQVGKTFTFGVLGFESCIETVSLSPFVVKLMKGELSETEYVKAI